MKNYLIVGASSGIGLATAELLSQHHQVWGTYRNHTLDDKPLLSYHHMDVMSESLDFSFLPESLDGVVYCPGSINLKPFTRVSAEELKLDYELNVIGAIKTIQQVLPRLKKSTSASIVLFSTVAVQTGMSFHSIVASSKGAVEGLTRSLAAELSPAIRVNGIAPSLTETPLAHMLLQTEEKKQASALRHPLKRIGKPAELAEAVSFLLSDASSWITGQIIHIDGGMGSIK